jgi:hypothetical protein
MTYRFPEMWLVQGLLECDFDTAVDQMTLLFVNALGMDSAEAGTDLRPTADAITHARGGA